MFKLTAETASAIIAEEDALATLRQHGIDDILSKVDDIEGVDDEEAAFNALMGAMYALRPQGYL